MLRFLLNSLLVLSLLAMLSIGGVLWYLLPGLPSIEDLRETRLQVPLRVFTREYSLIAEFGEKRRSPVKVADVPDTIKQAFLAAEDDRFYQHPGVDWQGLLRAVIHLVKTGEKGQGGSTITMQVARNFFLSREKTYLRKLNEILLALKIENELQKDEIFELYLNKIYLGHRAYGVSAAAEVYYGNDLEGLKLAQAAMIASLPKAPSRINPITSPERAIQRRDYVLGRMLKLGFIDNEAYNEAIAQTISASYHGQSPEVEAPYVAEMIRAEMLRQYGEEAYTSGLRVVTSIEGKLQIAANQALRKALIDYDQRHGYRGAEHQFGELISASSEDDWHNLLEAYTPIGGLNAAMVTALDEQTATVYSRQHGQFIIEWPGLSWARRHINANRMDKKPKTAAEILAVGDVIRYQYIEEKGWRLAQIPDIEGALVSMDPETGQLLALAGGFDFSRSKFNRVTQALRQPGSNFKPFIYSAAFEKGFTAASLVNDAPVVFDDVSLESKWRPENYSGKYFGPTRLREALTKSRNLISIRLLRSIGIPFAIEYASRFGFKPEDLPPNLSLSLGSASLTPLQIVTGYAVFANGGYRVEPNYISRIEDYDGEVIFENDPITVCRQCEQPTELEESLTSSDTEPQTRANIAPRVVDERNVWLINSILRDVITRGTGRRARSLGRKDLSGKTGTTNDQNDAWFSGFNSRIVTTAWVGFDQLQTLGKQETGGRAALPMWIDYMRVALEGMPESVMHQPEGLVTVRIDPATGKQTSADNPKAMFEVFRDTYVPEKETGTALNNGSLPDANGIVPDIPEQLF